MAQILLQGTGRLLAKLEAAKDLAPKALASAALMEMEQVMAESKSVAPVDMGVLRDSGTVLPPEFTPTGVEIVMGYGGAASDYAIVQHERLDFNHTEGQQAKYLEEPFLAAIPELDARMAEGVRAALTALQGF